MKDKISSLFDNEFTDSELDSLLSDVTKNKSHQTNWSYYQITRDVLQGNYVTSSPMTAKIMQAIEKEPTQMGGFVQNSVTTLRAEFNYLPHVFAFSVLILIAAMLFNSPINSNSVNSVLLVQDEIPAEMMQAHFAHTATNASYFVQTGLSNIK